MQIMVHFSPNCGLTFGPLNQSQNEDVVLLLTCCSGALTCASIPGMFTLFLCKYLRKTSALRRASVHAFREREKKVSYEWIRTKSLIRTLLENLSACVYAPGTLRKASFCSRCLLIMGVTWSDSEFGPSLSVPPHQSSSRLYSCSKLSSTLHTCRTHTCR